MTIWSYIKKVFRGEIPLLRGDKVLWLIYFLLIFVSILEVYSASSMRAYGGNISGPIVKHLTIVFISTVGAIVISHLRWKFIKSLHFWFYLLAVVALLWATFFGIEENDAQRSFVVMGISIQPSEILKPAIVFVAAFLFGARHKLTPRQAFYWFWGLVLLPTCFVFFESGSTAMILLFIAWLICFVSNPIKKDFWRLTGVVAVGGALMLLLVVVLPPSALTHFGRAATWHSRIMGNNLGVPDSVYNQLTKAERDSAYYIIDGANYQRKHAQIAISRGGVSPVGVFPGNSKARDFLPEAHNDFIYAIIIEEMGYVGAIAVPLLYLFYFFRLGAWGKKAMHKQQQLLLYGMGLLYVFQALLNMGVASALFPLMGQTLPLISTGGSSFLFTAFSYGFTMAVVASIREEREEIKRRAIQVEAEEHTNTEEYNLPQAD